VTKQIKDAGRREWQRHSADRGRRYAPVTLAIWGRGDSELAVW